MVNTRSRARALATAAPISEAKEIKEVIKETLVENGASSEDATEIAAEATAKVIPTLRRKISKKSSSISSSGSSSRKSYSVSKWHPCETKAEAKEIYTLRGNRLQCVSRGGNAYWSIKRGEKYIPSRSKNWVGSKPSDIWS